MKFVTFKKIATWAAISDIESRFPKDKEFTAWQEDGYYFKRNGRTKQAMPHKFLQYESFEQNKMRLNIQTYCKNSTTPTCVIHGEDDDSVSINEGKKIARWLNKELVVIKEAKHTFGSSQPWRIAVLPNQLKEVCDVTLDFFIEEREKSTPDEKVKLSLLSDLIKLARVDDAFRDAEFKFLVAIAGQLGISNNDFKRLFDQYIEFNPPKMEMDRIIQFQRLILLMNVDLEVMESEIQYVRDIGIKMGLHPDATEEVLVKMKEYPRRVVPPHVLLEIFRTYHN